MTTLSIEDLAWSRDLDQEARAKVLGGRMSFGWITPYTEQTSSSSPFNLLVGEVNVYNYNLIDPVFHTVNQVEYTKIDIGSAIDSSITNTVGQSQTGLAT
ncbi:hypothetical protein [Thiorhodococcus minor]|uniref:Uncharacterized protein n=1 Tax=Thiorhodococcus minor TaxID=57489 RepID=A0A6M0K1X8_9GAMM|nr:hypothetical protein [Thiorhodococcus minor]NEV63341.1 hypothetical protein [Thiorhodococcus minor]